MNEAVPYLPAKTKRLLKELPTRGYFDTTEQVVNKVSKQVWLKYPPSMVRRLEKNGLVEASRRYATCYRMTDRGRAVRQAYLEGAKPDPETVPWLRKPARPGKTYPRALDEDMPTQEPFKIREIYWHPSHGTMCGSPDEPCSCRQPEGDRRPHSAGCICPICRANDPGACEHPNEAPCVCPCPEGCYCKTRTCRRPAAGRVKRFTPGEMRAVLYGRLDSEAYLIQKGVRPLYMASEYFRGELAEWFVAEARSVAEGRGLCFFSEIDQSGVIVAFAKHRWVLNVATWIAKQVPPQHAEALRGLLHGYSIDEIAAFLRKNYLDLPEADHEKGKSRT